MNFKPHVDICIQAWPNPRGIDHARLAMTEAVRQRLLHLCTVMQTHGLIAIQCEDLPVQWYKAGELQTARHHTTCEVVGKLADQDMTLYVAAHFPVEVDGRGVVSASTTVQGHWFWGVTAELDADRLLDLANVEGEIWATADSGWPARAVTTSHARMVRAVRQVRIAQAQSGTLGGDLKTWPDPFSRWSGGQEGESRAPVRLPRDYASVPRSAVAEASLILLFRAALELTLDPNQRCALYTLAAALLICPDEVGLSLKTDDIPSFLKHPDHREDDEQPLTMTDLAPPRRRFCGTCETEFVASRKTIHVRYQALIGQLTINNLQVPVDWTVAHGGPDLALLYEDHANNEFARLALKEHLPNYPDDHARLKLLAFGLDALKRQLDAGYPWGEDLRVWLAGDGFYNVNGNGAER